MTTAIPIENIIFYSFSVLALISASMMVILRNPIKSLLCLALVFVCNAALWVLLSAEFLSMILILVYVGAIMVLFLFVVMMIDIENTILQRSLTRYFPMGIVAYLLMSALLVYIVKPFILRAPSIRDPNSIPNDSLHTLGILLYTEYLYPLVVAGVLLLVAMVVAISLSFKKKSHNKAIDPSLQIRVHKDHRLRLAPVDPSRGKT